MFGLSALHGYVLAGGLALAVAGAGAAYLKGRADANGKCRAAELQAHIDVLERDIDAARNAFEIERRLSEARAAEADALERKVADYEQDLAARPDGRCILDDRDVRALDGLSGHGGGQGGRR